ncbi:MAG: ABC transporter ATP-binding protein [Lachnospiraceae bacterium]|nr:ABC transporter ATP-binding protein [Lachnospiraceae bacterium]
MIKADNVRKLFGKKKALSGISCTIPDGSIYGMVGSNGAGKSTLLRILSGVYKPDAGSVLIDGAPVWENPEAKGKVALVADEVYFPAGMTMGRMAALTAAADPGFDRGRLAYMSDLLHLDMKASLGSFSKGMKRQAAIALALCRKPKYLLLDEAFDGLDPVMRRLMRGLLAEEIMDRQMTTVITSHSLRELEDTCDTLALLHRGGLILESDIGTLKTNLFKIQIAFEDDFDKDRFEGIGILDFRKSGSVATMIVKGDSSHAAAVLRKMNPLLMDILPLSLEEVFAYEMEALGYSFTPEGIAFADES